MVLLVRPGNSQEQSLSSPSMIISHTHKYIFIKSKKTASTSIEAALSGCCGADDIVTPLGDYHFNRDESGAWIHRSMNAGDFEQHDWATTIKSKVDPGIWNNYFKFSIARNPWDRAVSLFAWENRNRPLPEPPKRFYHRLGIPFDPLRQTRKHFLRFLQGDWDTNDLYYIIDGELCVDFVIRYEHVAEDLRSVCKTVGLPEIALPRLKTGIRKQRHHYSDYYDEEAKAIVAKRHENDIRLFGYKFETA
jgi:hypothetical protein